MPSVRQASPGLASRHSVQKLETLLRGLELESKGNLNLPVIIVADSAATHQSVVTAIDAIGQAGFARLSIATQRSEQSGIVDPNY